MIPVAAGHLKMITDFRRVYASVIEGWTGMDDASATLKAEFLALPVFGVT